MTTTKRIGVSARFHRPKTAREDRLALRPKPADRIVRWIGVGKRQPSEQVEEADAEVPELRIVRLSWADTFGRLARPAIPVLGHTATPDVQVLQFRRRSEVEGTLPLPYRSNGQPPVPVLR